MMDLKACREKIDKIDEAIASLFAERMDITNEVARYKRENSLPILNHEREQEVLRRAALVAGEHYADAAKTVFNIMMDMSRANQALQNTDKKDLFANIKRGYVFPAVPSIVCQGVDGAYSGEAARVLFPSSTPSFVESFEDVFMAIKDSKAEFGILPIENSTAGSVSAVYDLLRKYGFYIVSAHKLRISHCLLATKGTNFADIRTVVSHPQAIMQCSKLFSQSEDITPQYCQNTAVAARMVADRNEKSFAAIASKRAAQLYGLDIIKENAQDEMENYTRFICISRDFLCTSGANKISLSLSLPHESGSLYRILARFAALGLNLTKLESRPIPGSDFEFMFYFDFEGSVLKAEVSALLNELSCTTEQFCLLGNFEEA